jgi:putative ABC transport system permease protein
MNRAYLIAVLSYHRTRTLAGVLSIAIGVTLFITLQAFSQAYKQAARAPLTEVGANLTAQRQGDVPESFEGNVFPHSVAPIHSEEIGAIRSIPGVEDIVGAVFFWSFEPDGFIAGLGFDPLGQFGPGRLQAAVIAGRFLRPDDRQAVLLDASFAVQRGVNVGQIISLDSQPFEVVGLVDSGKAGRIANANLYLPLYEAQRLASVAPNVLSVHDMRPDDVNLLYIKTEQTQAEIVAAEVADILGEKALVSSATSFQEQLGAFFRLVDRFGWLVGGTAFLFAALILLRTVAIGIWERRREIGLMRAVGWRQQEVIRELFTETLLVASLGSGLGLLLSVLFSALIRRTSVAIPVPWELSPTPHFLPGGAQPMAVTVSLAAEITFPLALAPLGLALIGSLLVGLWLPGRIAAVKPVEVLYGE